MSMTLKYTRYYRHLFFGCSLSDKGLLACVIVFLAIPQVATRLISTISRSYNAAMVLSPVGEDMMVVELAAVSGRRKNLHSAPMSKLNGCGSDSKPRFLSQKKRCNTAGSEDVGLWYKTGGICKTDSENTRTPAWTRKLSAVRRATQTQSQLGSWDSDDARSKLRSTLVSGNITQELRGEGRRSSASSGSVWGPPAQLKGVRGQQVGAQTKTKA